ncbi:hypothetical protein TWF281_004963 [Arthrobotrys megalospora]
MANRQDGSSSIFRAPQFIRRLFDHFPLITYPVDPPPMSAQELAMTTRQLQAFHSSGVNTLYIFTEDSDSDQVASFNPACLKWQTYLKIRGINFTTIPSNNHASPSGSLPFLTVSPPSSSSSERQRIQRTVIPVAKLAQWVEDNAPGTVNTVDTEGADYRAFLSLVEGAVRDAWLYALYIDPINLSNITIPKYTSTTPLWPITHFLGNQMRQAAIDSIKKSTSSESTLPTGEEIYTKANEAFSALSTLLNSTGNTWFFGADEAGMFDASVFAYTYLILSLEISGSGEVLVESLYKFKNLVEHSERIRRRWFS